jgi:hypothetical protein
MGSNATATVSTTPRVIPETRPTMAKADLRIPESCDLQAEIGQCLDYARRVVGWTLEQLAATLKRDPRQIARWIRGEERTQVDVVFGCEDLRQPFVVALALLARCEVETTVRMRKLA